MSFGFEHLRGINASHFWLIWSFGSKRTNEFYKWLKFFAGLHWTLACARDYQT